MGQHHTTSSKAVPEGNLMEQWLARGRGASMRSLEVAKITQSHTQPQNSSKGTPAVVLNSPTNTATGEEHLTLHRKSKEPEGTLGCLLALNLQLGIPQNLFLKKDNL